MIEAAAEEPTVFCGVGPSAFEKPTAKPEWPRWRKAVVGAQELPKVAFVSNLALRETARIKERAGADSTQNCRRDNQRLNFGEPGKFAEVSGFSGKIADLAN